MTYYHLTILNYLDTFEFSSCIWCNALECDGTIFFAPTAFYKLDDSATNFNCKKGNNITEQAVQEAPRPSLSHTLVWAVPDSTQVTTSFCSKQCMHISRGFWLINRTDIIHFDINTNFFWVSFLCTTNTSILACNLWSSCLLCRKTIFTVTYTCVKVSEQWASYLVARHSFFQHHQQFFDQPRHYFVDQ